VGRAYVPRENLGGNFCGHAPLSPRFTLARPAKTGKGGIPRVLTLCAERLKDYYYSPRKVIPSLDLANGQVGNRNTSRRMTGNTAADSISSWQNSKKNTGTGAENSSSKRPKGCSSASIHTAPESPLARSRKTSDGYLPPSPTL